MVYYWCYYTESSWRRSRCFMRWRYLSLWERTSYEHVSSSEWLPRYSCLSLLAQSVVNSNKQKLNTVYFTSFINQQLHLHNFHTKHFKNTSKSLRHVSILSDQHQRALLFLAKVILQYSQFNSFLQTRCCGSMSCCVGMCCRESSWLGVRRMHINSALHPTPQRKI